MRIAVACDHRGFAYKEGILQALMDDGHEVLDLGTSSVDPVDYPDFAVLVGVAVRDQLAEVGVLVCGSGAGVSIAANKIRGVRAALCHDLYTARQAREHDDANVICLGSRVVALDLAVSLVREFVTARFGGESRHARRLGKVLRMETDDPPALPGRPTVRARDLPDVPAVGEALGRLDRLEVPRRLWERDAGLWSPEAGVQAVIKERLGWLDLPATMASHAADLAAFAAEVRQDAITDVVLLGMGGSSLAAEVLARTLAPAAGPVGLTVLDTTNPSTVRAAMAGLRLPRTLFLVSSKSGTTTETMALARFFRAELERQVPRAESHLVAITDAGTPLARLAAETGFRRIFLGPSDVGGRFSALSFFGLVPATLAGVDPVRVLASASAMATACGRDVPVGENPALRLAAALGGLPARGADKVTLVLSPSVVALGRWIEQLVTESTGKHGRGLVVVDGEPIGSPEVYGHDRVFVVINLAGEPVHGPAVEALEAAGHPVIRLTLHDRHDLGAEFVRWEIATAAAGILLGVNPFDEPDVARTKATTQAALAAFAETGRLPERRAGSLTEIVRILTTSRPGDYVAILAYLAPRPDTERALRGLATLVRDRTRLPATVGFGPRYLHSTGQLHKGGPASCIAVVLTDEEPDELPLPGERHGFATLHRAQALGDLSALEAAGRRTVWLPIERPVPEAIEQMTAELARSLGT